MANSDWGLCKDCKWWQIEPKAAVENLTMGLCIAEEAVEKVEQAVKKVTE
jgi:hypothetical protein